MRIHLNFLPLVEARLYQLRTMTLADLNQNKEEKINQVGALKARIEGFHGDPTLVERLKEMGLHQGLEVTAVGRAPFGGPMLFRFGNTVLALRLEEAQCAMITTN